LLIGMNKTRETPLSFQPKNRLHRETLTLVKRGGPFPYPKDGVVFGNYEKSLPVMARGYYHEYTVRTPGIRGRGARRLVAGGRPALKAEYYYTDDHYMTFRRIRE